MIWVFLCILGSANDAIVVNANNANGNKTLVANGSSVFFIKDKPIFISGPKFDLKLLLIVLF